MFGLGIPELIVIFVIALIVFGPKKLPDLGKSIGRAMAEFKKASQDFQETIQEEMRDVEKAADVKQIAQLDQIAPPEADKGKEEEKKKEGDEHGNSK